MGYGLADGRSIRRTKIRRLGPLLRLLTAMLLLMRAFLVALAPTLTLTRTFALAFRFRPRLRFRHRRGWNFCNGFSRRFSHRFSDGF